MNLVFLQNNNYPAMSCTESTDVNNMQTKYTNKHLRLP